MNYQTENITDRAMQSALWPVLSKQNGKALPFLLERYLLLENWDYLKRREMSAGPFNAPPVNEEIHYDLSFVHFLLADAMTVILDQAERIDGLERRVDALEGAIDW